MAMQQNGGQPLYIKGYKEGVPSYGGSPCFLRGKTAAKELFQHM